MSYSKLISLGGLLALIGYILSGPVGFFLVQFVKPQPAWSSSMTFAQNYHIIQDVPFYFGFLLMGGMLMLSAGHYLNYKEENTGNKFYLLMAFGFSVAFVALISFNYVSQTIFVRHLALNYSPDNDFAIASFSMANPRSFCWANEIWGYGVLGISTWLMGCYYTTTNRLIYALLVINGIVSIVSVVLTIIDTSWLMTISGLSAYFTWNLLMITLMVLIYRYHR